MNFINIPHNQNKYFHIYLNNSKEEIQKMKNTKNLRIKKIKVIIDYEIKSLSYLFKGITYIKKINFIKFKRNDIKSLFKIFYCCDSLEEIDLTNFNTDNVKDMSFMFYKCSSLKQLNLSNFNTINVTNMSLCFINAYH